VTTDDGYILQMFRIRSPRTYIITRLYKGLAPAVLLQHGLTCSSDIFIMSDRDRSVPFRLASAGYDVWLGNNRGNKYSRKHVSLDPDKENQLFFDFSF